MSISIVVGGTRGIGIVITDKLKSRGDTVYTVSRSSAGDGHHISVDLLDIKRVELAFSSLGEIDTVRNLVFSQRYRGNGDFDSESTVMLKSTQVIIESLIPFFEESASIVVLGSVLGKFVGEELSLSYHISRAALEQLVRYYAVSLGAKGIRINCVVPGTVLKPEHSTFDKNRITADLEATVPLKRVGTAEDVAGAVAFFCSDRSSFITGQSIFVDGGVSLLSQESLSKKISQRNS